LNDFISKSLGIKINNFRSQKTYVLSSKQLMGNRFDPNFFQAEHKEFDNLLKQGRYKLEPLTNLLENIISGQRPKGGVRQITEGITSLGGEHILDDGTIRTTGLKFIPPEFHQIHIKSKIEDFDILLVKDGATTGRVGFIKQLPFDQANINEHLFLLRTKKNINPYYLFTVLKSKIGQNQIHQQITGGTITGIVRASLDNIKIPLPQLEIQNQIAAEAEKKLNETINLEKKINGLDQIVYKEAEKIIQNLASRVDGRREVGQL